MFDDQTNQQSTQDDNSAPVMGLGTNPDPSAAQAQIDDQSVQQPDPANDMTAPMVVEPTEPASAEEPVDEVPAEDLTSTGEITEPSQDENFDAPEEITLPSPIEDTPVVDSSSNNAGGDLDDLKRQALDQLSPLVHKLDQSPEEKYKTVMMLIQASDNQDLLNEAYEAAQAITDEKAKAEALLNIVNEINYFTQKN